MNRPLRNCNLKYQILSPSGLSVLSKAQQWKSLGKIGPDCQVANPSNLSDGQTAAAEDGGGGGGEYQKNQVAQVVHICTVRKIPIALMCCGCIILCSVRITAIHASATAAQLVSHGK